jgi:hypothetical protein
MKKLLSSPDNPEVELVKNMLADVGILCEVRNGEVSGIVPVAPFYEELWVQDEDFEKASDLVDTWRRPSSTTPGAWTCPQCGERVDAQFTSCWKCGTPRPIKTEDGRV